MIIRISFLASDAMRIALLILFPALWPPHLLKRPPEPLEQSMFGFANRRARAKPGGRNK
jgi:hypothetical protein